MKDEITATSAAKIAGRWGRTGSAKPRQPIVGFGEQRRLPIRPLDLGRQRQREARKLLEMGRRQGEADTGGDRRNAAAASAQERGRVVGKDGIGLHGTEDRVPCRKNVMEGSRLPKTEIGQEIGMGHVQSHAVAEQGFDMNAGPHRALEYRLAGLCDSVQLVDAHGRPGDRNTRGAQPNSDVAHAQHMAAMLPDLPGQQNSLHRVSRIWQRPILQGTRCPGTAPRRK